MKKLLLATKNKLAFLSAIALAAVIGGATVAIVSAAIPDNGGVIHSCRNTFSGALKVIDTEAGQSCGSFEAALNWSQQPSPIAYAHVFIDQNGQATLDAARSKNVASVYSNPNVATGIFCLTVNGTPKNITAASGNGAAVPNGLAFKDQNGWSSSATVGSAYFCSQNSPVSNVGFYDSFKPNPLMHDDIFVTVF